MKPECLTCLCVSRTAGSQARTRSALAVLLAALLVATVLPSPGSVLAAEGGPPPTTHMTCGECPSGFATTGVTTDATACKEGEHQVVQCVPLGSMKLLAVCGSCPEGYATVGSSNVPARCGSIEGGLLSQCQASDLGGGMPDPNKGGVFCPPNCAGQTPEPGQGAVPPPPKYMPAPEQK